MKILVTGGAGYIGSIVVEQLVAAGERLSCSTISIKAIVQAVHPEAVFVKGDLAERAAVDAVMAEHRPEGIMHFASHTLVGESMQKPFLYIGDNVTNGLNLLQSAVEHGVRRFILSSTANLFDEPSASRLPRPSASCRAARTASPNILWNACCTGSTASMACAMRPCAISTRLALQWSAARTTILSCT